MGHYALPCYKEAFEELNDENMDELFDIRYYESHFEKGRCIIQEEGGIVSLAENDKHYMKFIIPDDPDAVCTQLLFDHATLKMCSYGQFLKKGNEKIGVWRSFDENGEVTYEKDYETDYPLSWDKAYEILQNMGIHFNDIKLIGRQINPDATPIWYFFVSKEIGTMGEIQLDANTGKVLLNKYNKVKSLM